MLDNGIVFDARIAEKYSVEEAIVIAKIYGWIKHNATNGKNFHEGRYWTFNSLAAFAKYFPFWSESKVKRILISLAGKAEGESALPKHEQIILKSNFNNSPFDRTVWYSFTDEFFAYLKGLGYELNAEKQQEELPFSDFDQMDNPQTDKQYQINNTINDKKEKLFKKKEDADYYDGLLTLNINKDIAMDFMQLRKTKKATNSARSFDLVKRAIETVTQRLNITPTNVIEICLSRGWYGCQVSYFDSVKLSDYGITPTSQPSTALKSPHEKIDEMGNRYYIQGSTKVIIPPDAPPRPNPMVYWNTIYNHWYQPF